MPVLLLIARLLLSGVFALAGVGKLLDPAGSRKAVVSFGLPALLAGPLGLLLPFAELAVSIALIPPSTAIYGAVGALVLLLAFVAGIANSLAHGRRHDCHCFGQLHSEPVGWPVLARNVVLAVIAGFVVIAGRTDAGPSMVDWLTYLTDWQLAVVIGGTLALAGLGLQSVLLLKLVGQNAQLLQRLETPTQVRPMDSPVASGTITPAVMTLTSSSAASPSLLSVLTMTAPTQGASSPAAAPESGRQAGWRIGSPAPAFSLPNLEGNHVTVATLSALGKPAILFFSDPECGQCLNLLPDMAKWRQAYASRFTLAIVSRGTPDANREKFGDHAPELVLMQRDREVILAYGVPATPSAVMLATDGTIGSQTALGEAEVRQLVDGLAGVPSQRASELGTAPEFELVDIDGHPVGSAQLRGQQTLVLFWNPTCPYCERMLGDLKAWEALPLTERPELLVVSTGTAELNRAQGLRSKIALDPAFTTASRFGLEGTPSAVLLDEQGRLVGPPAIGAFAIFALAGRLGALVTERPDEPAPGAATMEPLAAPLPVLPPDATPIQQSCTQDELLADGGIILYSGCRQQVTTLNATGAFIWECCDGEHDVDAIIAEVRDIYPAAENLDRDVRAVLDQLLQAGMIAAAGDSAVTPSSATSAPTGV